MAEQPAWSAMDCDKCLKYRVQSGELVKDRGGEYLPDPKTKAFCNRTPCGGYDKKPRWDWRWSEIAETYRQLKHFGRCVSEPGDIEMSILVVMAEYDRMAERAMMSKMASGNPLAAMMMMAGGRR